MYMYIHVHVHVHVHVDVPYADVASMMYAYDIDCRKPVNASYMYVYIL